MTLIATALLAILGLTGAVHLAWALRLWWPLHDETALARVVVGNPGIRRMPGQAVTLLVVGLSALAVVWVTALAGWLTLPLPGRVVTAGGWVMAAVLLIRGLVTYIPPVSRTPWEAPFGRLNRWIYSPLIVTLGLGVVALLLVG